MRTSWQPGDVISWRGIYRNRIWHCQPTILVKESQDEIALMLLPGAECTAERTYPEGKTDANRRWSFIDKDWQLATYTWQTNRLLLLFEPEKYYATVLFWNHQSHDFLCYYINFQLPFERNHQALDTLDLDLDLIIYPDFTYKWKDVEDYERAIEYGVISAESVQAIENETSEIFRKLEHRQYPFDGSWLNWIPDPAWTAPKLPSNWDKI